MKPALDQHVKLVQTFRNIMPRSSNQQIERVTDTIVHPTKLIDWEPENMSSGVQFADGSFLASANLTRTYQNGSRYETQLPPPVAQANQSLAKGFFAGLLDHRYGHFLLESLSRMYMRDSFPDHPIVWSARCDVPQPGFQVWQKDLLDLLGISGPHFIVTEPCSVAELLIAQRGYVIQHEFLDKHREFLAKVMWRPQRGSKTWLSRRNQTRRSITAMTALEECLSSAGWNIIVPETLSVQEQLDILSSSERIAGPYGSALHSLILLKNVEGLRVDIFVANPLGTEDLINQNYITIARAKEFHQNVHFIPNNRFLEDEIISIPDFIQLIQDYLA